MNIPQLNPSVNLARPVLKNGPTHRPLVAPQPRFGGIEPKFPWYLEAAFWTMEKVATGVDKSKKFLNTVSGGRLFASKTPAAPKTDAPKTDAPKTDAPKTDAPKTDAPKTDDKPNKPE